MRCDEHYYADVLHLALVMFEQGARGSGRTEDLLEIYKEGDIVIVKDSQAGRQLEMALRVRGDKRFIKWTVVDPKTPLWEANVLRGNDNPIHLDHTWLLAYFEHAISDAALSLINYKKCRTRESVHTEGPTHERKARHFHL